MKKVGLITFHRSHNCGSMLQSLALQEVIRRLGFQVEIIDFSNKGQQELYSIYPKIRSIKSLAKKIIFFFARKRLENNYKAYENFIYKEFFLSKEKFDSVSQLFNFDDSNFFAIVAGSDQIWNITIQDGDDAYFLPWVKHAKRIAYAPSFGAKNISVYAEAPEKYKRLLEKFSHISIRENNGKKWCYELIAKEVPVLLDPTLLLEREFYAKKADELLSVPKKYIFYYCPSYHEKCNIFVKKISEKYDLPVIAFNSKSFYIRRMWRFGFELPGREDPYVYLSLMSSATLVITNSFHGTIFSSIFKKKFWILKWDGMLSNDDDRVMTLIQRFGLEERLVYPEFSNEKDYLKAPDYKKYDDILEKHKEESLQYLKEALEI